MKFMSKIAGLLLTAGLSAVLVGGAAQAAPFAGVFKPIKSVANPDRCLQPDVPALNAGVVQRQCDPNNPAQGWQFQQVGNHHYRFINQQTGLCFRAYTKAANGSPIGVATCNGQSNLEFNTNVNLPEIVVLESRIGFDDTGFCVDVPGASPQLGLQMQLFTCNGTPAQRWVVGFD
jgi:hypothetical protein